jgi:hypothetical protein
MNRERAGSGTFKTTKKSTGPFLRIDELSRQSGTFDVIRRHIQPWPLQQTPGAGASVSLDSSSS